MKTHAEILDTILAKSSSDEQFRDRLISDPRAACREATGITVPDWIGIEVHEQSATDLHLVLPVEDKMSINELEDVAGGEAYQTAGPGFPTSSGQ